MGNKTFWTAGAGTCPAGGWWWGLLVSRRGGEAQFSQSRASVGRPVLLNYQRCIFAVVCFTVGRGSAGTVCV